MNGCAALAQLARRGHVGPVLLDGSQGLFERPFKGWGRVPDRFGAELDTVLGQKPRSRLRQRDLGW
jgi:hypothetical protein